MDWPSLVLSSIATMIGAGLGVWGGARFGTKLESRRYHSDLIRSRAQRWREALPTVPVITDPALVPRARASRMRLEETDPLYLDFINHHVPEIMAGFTERWARAIRLEEQIIAMTRALAKKLARLIEEKTGLSDASSIDDEEFDADSATDVFFAELIEAFLCEIHHGWIARARREAHEPWGNPPFWDQPCTSQGTDGFAVDADDILSHMGAQEVVVARLSTIRPRQFHGAIKQLEEQAEAFAGEAAEIRAMRDELQVLVQALKADFDALESFGILPDNGCRIVAASARRAVSERLMIEAPAEDPEAMTASPAPSSKIQAARQNSEEALS